MSRLRLLAAEIDAKAGRPEEEAEETRNMLAHQHSLDLDSATVPRVIDLIGGQAGEDIRTAIAAGGRQANNPKPPSQPDGKSTS